MSKCEISSCKNEATKSINTIVADPSRGLKDKRAIQLCEEHYKRITLSSANAFSVRTSTNGKPNHGSRS